MEGRAAAGQGEEEWSPAELSSTEPSQTQPCASCWQQTGSFERGGVYEKDSCSKAKAERQKPQESPEIGAIPRSSNKNKPPLGFAELLNLLTPPPLIAGSIKQSLSTSVHIWFPYKTKTCTISILHNKLCLQVSFITHQRGVHGGCGNDGGWADLGI